MANASTCAAHALDETDTFKGPEIIRIPSKGPNRIRMPLNVSDR
jgi:hypothetical protein